MRLLTLLFAAFLLLPLSTLAAGDEKGSTVYVSHVRSCLDKYENDKTMYDICVGIFNLGYLGNGIEGGNGDPNPKSGNAATPITENTTCPASPNPVVLTTGEKLKEEADFFGLGDYGLGLNRLYRSKSTSGAMFGSKWLSNLDGSSLRTLSTESCLYISEEGNCVKRTVVLTEPDGSKLTFKLTNGATEPVLTYGSQSSLSAGDLQHEPGGNWTLFRGHNTYTFSLSGQLLAVDNASGAGMYYVYDQNTGRLNSIANSVGKTVTLGWGGK